ncbi:hypothetical protein Elgi_49360 [Paenibacillus elgii]|nr:hypothetical protein Elgi_49360 [Paenibacillus elgii]
MHSISFQLNMSREWSIDVAELCPEELADIQLELFNNTIRWQVGRLLYSANGQGSSNKWRSYYEQF